jgi:hypothetical protein
MSQCCRVVERASSARARRGRMLVAGFIVPLSLVGLGFIDPGAIAQEVAGEYRRRMAMDPTVLSIEQKKAKAAKPGSVSRNVRMAAR